MLVLRGIILALTATLAVALLVRGNVVIGGLLAAIVAARIVLIVTLRRRRRELRSAFRERVR